MKFCAGCQGIKSSTMNRDNVTADVRIETTPASKRKTVSSNLMNMKVIISAPIPNIKFMQRSHDVEVAAKLKRREGQVLSDQQWHLSVAKENDIVK
jgi:hypothetical protein